MRKGSVVRKAHSRNRKGSQFETEKIIEALIDLKRRRKYPALPGEVCTALSLPKSQTAGLKEYLLGLGKEGIVTPSWRTASGRRYRAYMLAGEDTRYATRRGDLFKLKFELLGEIEGLKGQILELEANAQADQVTDGVGRQEEEREPESLDEIVLRKIAALSRDRNSRTLTLWEVRSVFSGLDPAKLDESLERLGSSWRLELQPVQDSTKMSPEEKGALLRLSDGTLVAALAVASD